MTPFFTHIIYTLNSSSFHSKIPQIQIQKPPKSNFDPNMYGIKASDCNPKVVIGFTVPPVQPDKPDKPSESSEPAKQYTVAVRYNSVKHSDKDGNILEELMQTIGACEGARVTTNAGEEIQGLLLVKFTKKEDARRAQDLFDDKKAVGGTVRLRIRDFEQRGETYEGCFLDKNRMIILLTRAGNSAREVPFGKIGEVIPPA
ncbi:MAG: hypothetical protein ASARMPRED_000334 [Alectoria sarmentosa]|nr:MAG: hypothetical protein ASARMPRED_000334 [Alectoria sarmentosa]